MKIIGVELEKPSFWHFTLAVILACVLWGVGLAVMNSFSEISAAGAGVYLVAMLSGCIANVFGVYIGAGWRQTILVIAFTAFVVSVYAAIVILV